MKRISIVALTLVFLAAFTSAYGQGNSNSQAGGLPALSAEVARLRALVESLQEQIGESGDPYAGTYAATLVETALFGCTAGFVPPPGQPLIPYLITQGNSSVSSRTASFDVESDGSTLVIPEFVLLTNELRLSGRYQEDVRLEGDIEVTVNADGSLDYTGDEDAVFTGQISADGSLFSLLVQGFYVEAGSGCSDSYTVSVIGVKK